MVNVCFATGNGEKQKLHEELTQMIGDTGTKVPGMGVIVYKDGKEVFSDFLGSAIVDSKIRRIIVPLRDKAVSGWHPYPRCLRSLRLCSCRSRASWT